MPTQLADIIQPDQFTAYQVQKSMLSTALFQSGVAVPNGEMEAPLSAGAESFTVPYWNDLPDVEANITKDNPAILLAPCLALAFVLLTAVQVCLFFAALRLPIRIDQHRSQDQEAETQAFEGLTDKSSRQN